MNYINNKKAGTGKEWIYALSILFALSVLYLLFNSIFNYHLAPTFIGLMPDTEAGQQGIEGIQQYLTYFKFIPLLIFGSIIIYFIILTVRKEPTEYY